MIDWDQLRMVSSVIRDGSVTLAAKNLGISQSTLTRQIAALEKSLGTSIFVRTSKGVELNDVAKALLVPLQEMEDAVYQVTRIVQSSRRESKGVVRICAGALVATYILPGLLLKIRDALIDIDIDLVCSEEQVDIESRESDISLSFIRPESTLLVTSKIAEYQFAVYASSTYIARHGEPLTVHELARHDLIGDDQIGLLLEKLIDAGVNHENIQFSVNATSQVAAWKLVESGIGIGFCLSMIAEKAPGVRRILPDFHVPILPLWLIAHNGYSTNERLRRVFNQLKLVFNQFAIEKYN